MPWNSIKLNDGHSIPSVAFGSAGHSDADTPDVIKTAIEVGFEHIDTAQMYRNEAGVGEGVKLSPRSRSELYITTKWSGYAPIKQSMAESLEKLGIGHVDLYLIHNPRITNGDIEGTWKEFEEVHKAGHTKSIGVSNYSVDDLKRVLKVCHVKPAVNQIILNPHVYHATLPLLHFMAEHNILAEGYSPLKPLRDGSSPHLVKVVEEIAQKRSVQPDQVLLAWSKAKGVLPITTSSNRERAAGYVAAGDLDLTDDEMDRIDRAGKKGSDVEKKWKGLVGVARGAAIVGLTLYALKVLGDQL